MAERQGSLLRLGRRKAFIKCGEIGGGVSQERGRENGGECVELKIFKLSTCFNIIAAAAARQRMDGRRRGFLGFGGQRRSGGGVGEESAVVKLKAAENLLEQTDDDERQTNRPQPPRWLRRD